MATILFTWELGQGYGHLTLPRQLVAELHAAGHRIAFAARDVGRAAGVIDDAAIDIVQAPLPLQTRVAAEASNLPQILLNCGFAEPRGLLARCRAWQWIYRGVAPDLLITDHSPTALVAARGSDVGSVIVSGTGFTVPPPGPFREFGRKADARGAAAAEQTALRSVNQVLGELGARPLAALSDLWSACEPFLLSFPELDPCRRQGVEFYGSLPSGGVEPEWPDGEGPRVYCYLHPYPGLPDLLALLRGAPWRSLVVCPRLDEDLRRRFANRQLRFSTELVDLAALAGDCDAGLTNGSHSTTAALLLAGIPVVVLAEQLEQSLNGQAVERLGAGRVIHGPQVRQVRPALGEILAHSRYSEQARAFAARYRDASLQTRNARLLEKIRELL